MDNVRITAKATDTETVLDKKEKGASSVEWQILRDNAMIPEEVLSLIPVTSVHTALYNGDDVCIDDCFESCYVDDETYKRSLSLLYDALSAASAAGKAQGSTVKVVVHVRNSVFPFSYGEMSRHIQAWLSSFPHTALALENNTVFFGDKTVRNASDAKSVPNLVRNIRKCLPEEFSSRVGSVLDTCHALATIRIKNTFLSKAGKEKSEDAELVRYFEESQDTCFILHFANALGYGNGPGEHGTAFPDVDFAKMFELRLRYVPFADLVIEMREDDYSDAENFAYTVRQIEAY